jgi:hypothetical protein
MAKIRNDILLQGLSSTTGQGLTAERDETGRPILSIPLTDDERFAVSRALADSHYASSAACEEMDGETAVGLRAEPGVQAVDMFHGWEIREVDPSDWHGEAGGVIRLHTRYVTDPIVVITDCEGRVIEQGVATGPDGSDVWTYRTSTTAPDSPRLIVTARDLPAHLQEVWLA